MYAKHYSWTWWAAHKARCLYFKFIHTHIHIHRILFGMVLFFPLCVGSRASFSLSPLCVCVSLSLHGYVPLSLVYIHINAHFLFPLLAFVALHSFQLHTQNRPMYGWANVVACTDQFANNRPIVIRNTETHFMKIAVNCIHNILWPAE